jgi:hypothetical protein
LHGEKEPRNLLLAMIRDEAWLELSEVSVTTLEILEAQQPHFALHLFQEGNKSALASVVVQAVETAPQDEVEGDRIVSIHPFLFEFLSQVADLIDTTTSQQQEQDEKEEPTQTVSIAKLPIEPLLDLGVDDNQKQQSCKGWTIHPIEISEMREQSLIDISCIYLESGVSRKEPQILKSLLKRAMEGRLIKKGSVVLLSTLHGFALVRITNVLFGNDSPVESNIAYHLSLSATFEVRINPPATTINNTLESPLDTQWHEDIPGYESLLQEMLALLRVHGSAAAPSGILLTGCPGVGKSRLALCIAHHYTKQGHIVCYLSTQDLVFRAISETDLFQDVIVPRTRGCALLILDDLQLLEGGDSDESQRDAEHTIVGNLILEAIDWFQDKCRIVGIGQVASKLPIELTKIGRLEKTVHLLPPTQVQRLHIWNNLLLTDDVLNNNTKETWCSALASSTAGCVAADLICVHKDALTRCHARQNTDKSTDIQWEDLRKAARSCCNEMLRNARSHNEKPFYAQCISSHKLGPT